MPRTRYIIKNLDKTTVIAAWTLYGLLLTGSLLVDGLAATI